jgi:hypothetical protein
MRCWVRKVAVAALLPCVLAGCGTALPARTGAGPSPAASGTVVVTPIGADVYSAAAAETKADAMFAYVRLPDATHVAAMPQGVLDGPPQQPDVSHLVDHHRFWTAPSTLSAFTAWVKAHPPEGFTIDGWSGGGSFPETGVEFYAGVRDGHTEILVSAQPAKHGLDVRVDTQVIWLSPKTGAEQIPTSVSTATVDYTGPVSSPPIPADTTPKPHHAHRVLVGTQLAAIVADLDALSLGTPGTEWSCPMDFGEQAIIGVRFGGRTVTFTDSLSGCGFVEVAANGHPQPYLLGSNQLTIDIYAAIGVTETPIPRVPSQGQPVTTVAPKVSVLEHSKVEAQRVGDLAMDVGSPADARDGGQGGSPPRPAYAGKGQLVDRAMFMTVTGTVAELVDWMRAHHPKGFVAAEPTTYPNGLRILVMEPVDRTKPVKAVVLVSMWQRADQVIYRIDAQTGWQS